MEMGSAAYNNLRNCSGVHMGRQLQVDAANRTGDAMMLSAAVDDGAVDGVALAEALERFAVRQRGAL